MGSGCAKCDDTAQDVSPASRMQSFDDVASPVQPPPTDDHPTPVLRDTETTPSSGPTSHAEGMCEMDEGQANPLAIAIQMDKAGDSLGTDPATHTPTSRCSAMDSIYSLAREDSTWRTRATQPSAAIVCELALVAKPARLASAASSSSTSQPSSRQSILISNPHRTGRQSFSTASLRQIPLSHDDTQCPSDDEEFPFDEGSTDGEVEDDTLSLDSTEAESSFREYVRSLESSSHQLSHD